MPEQKSRHGGVARVRPYCASCLTCEIFGSEFGSARGLARGIHCMETHLNKNYFWTGLVRNSVTVAWHAYGRTGPPA